MAYKNFKQKRDFNNKRQRGLLDVPDLKRFGPTESSFDSPIENSSNNGTRTAFQRLRSYDITVNKIDLNVAGAAPIYGSYNPRQLMKSNHPGLGLYTGALNNLYFNDTFRLLATISRDVGLNYWGMDLTSDQPANVRNYKAVQSWVKNITLLTRKIIDAQWVDLRIFEYQYNADTLTRQLFNYSTIFNPMEYIPIAYQNEILTVLLTALNFEMLVSQLPKLQELYKSKADFFIQVANELKRSRFTARIRSLITWIKQRWVDQAYFKQFVAPVTVVSKKTDGLNSPIIYLSLNTSIPIIPLQAGDDASTSTILQYMNMEDYTIVRNADGLITDVTANGQSQSHVNRNHNAFNIDTVLTMVLSAADQADFARQLGVWVNTSLRMLENLSNAALDFARNDLVIQWEAALSRISTAPGTGPMNWAQNTQFTSLNPIMQYCDWELVNELATFVSTDPHLTENGYIMQVPMFRTRGIPKQLQFEGSQAFYLASNANYWSYIKLGSRITMRRRDNRLYVWAVEKPNGLPVLRPQGDYTADEISLMFQDSFTYVFLTRTGNNYWTNPELMAMIPIVYQNLWADMEVHATQNFLVTQG